MLNIDEGIYTGSVFVSNADGTDERCVYEGPLALCKDRRAAWKKTHRVYILDGHGFIVPSDPETETETEAETEQVPCRFFLGSDGHGDTLVIEEAADTYIYDPAQRDEIPMIEFGEVLPDQIPEEIVAAAIETGTPQTIYLPGAFFIARGLQIRHRKISTAEKAPCLGCGEPISPRRVLCRACSEDMGR